MLVECERPVQFEISVTKMLEGMSRFAIKTDNYVTFVTTVHTNLFEKNLGENIRTGYS
jgi:hypothetical protein